MLEQTFRQLLDAVRSALILAWSRVRASASIRPWPREGEGASSILRRSPCLPVSSNGRWRAATAESPRPPISASSASRSERDGRCGVSANLLRSATPSPLTGACRPTASASSRYARQVISRSIGPTEQCSGALRDPTALPSPPGPQTAGRTR